MGNVKDGALPSVCIAGGSVLLHGALLANVRVLRLPVDEFLLSLSNNLELAVALLSFSLGLLLVGLGLLLLLLHALLDRLSAGKVITALALVSSVADVGELKVERGGGSKTLARVMTTTDDEED